MAVKSNGEFPEPTKRELRKQAFAKQRVRTRDNAELAEDWRGDAQQPRYDTSSARDELYHLSRSMLT